MNNSSFLIIFNHQIIQNNFLKGIKPFYNLKNSQFLVLYQTDMEYIYIG